MAIDYKQIQKDFNTRLTLMVDLVAKGRGIEILLRIADQTKKGLEAVDTYNEFVKLYPESKYNRDVEYMVTRVNKDLKKLQN